MQKNRLGRRTPRLVLNLHSWCFSIEEEEEYTMEVKDTALEEEGEEAEGEELKASLEGETGTATTVASRDIS